MKITKLPRNILSLFLTVVFLFSAVAPIHAYSTPLPLDGEIYPELKELGLTILKEFPPNEYAYVGVGRSPAPLIAFFQNIPEVEAINFPFTLRAFRHVDRARTILMDESSSTSLDSIPEELDRQRPLREHIEKFIPLDLLSRKKILAIDVALLGTSLQAAKLMLEAYASLNGLPENQVHALALKLGRSLDEFPTNDTSHVLSLSQYETVGEMFYHEMFKNQGVSEYEQFSLWRTQYDSSTFYIKFRKRLLQLMRADKILGTYFSNLSDKNSESPSQRVELLAQVKKHRIWRTFGLRQNSPSGAVLCSEALIH